MLIHYKKIVLLVAWKSSFQYCVRIHWIHFRVSCLLDNFKIITVVFLFHSFVGSTFNKKENVCFSNLNQHFCKNLVINSNKKCKKITISFAWTELYNQRNNLLFSIVSQLNNLAGLCLTETVKGFLELNIWEVKKWRYLPHYWWDKGLKGRSGMPLFIWKFTWNSHDCSFNT